MKTLHIESMASVYILISTTSINILRVQKVLQITEFIIGLKVNN